MSTQNSQSTPLDRKQIESHLLKKAGEDPAFRQTLISNPRQALEQEIGLQLPANFDLRVVEESANNLYLVLPAEHGELSDLELASVAGGFFPHHKYSSRPKPSAPAEPQSQPK